MNTIYKISKVKLMEKLSSMNHESRAYLMSVSRIYQIRDNDGNYDDLNVFVVFINRTSTIFDLEYLCQISNEELQQYGKNLFGKPALVSLPVNIKDLIEGNQQMIVLEAKKTLFMVNSLFNFGYALQRKYNRNINAAVTIIELHDIACDMHDTLLNAVANGILDPDSVYKSQQFKDLEKILQIPSYILHGFDTEEDEEAAYKEMHETLDAKTVCEIQLDCLVYKTDDDHFVLNKGDNLKFYNKLGCYEVTLPRSLINPIGLEAMPKMDGNLLKGSDLMNDITKILMGEQPNHFPNRS